MKYLNDFVSIDMSSLCYTDCVHSLELKHPRLIKSIAMSSEHML